MRMARCAAALVACLFGAALGVGPAAAQTAEPPVVLPFFEPIFVPAGDLPPTVTLAIDLFNQNLTTGLTGVGFTLSLPDGLAVAESPNAVLQCGVTFTPNPGDTTLSVAGGSIPAESACEVAVSVAVPSNLPEGAVTVPSSTTLVSDQQSGTGSTSPGTLSVGRPPTVSIAFAGSTVPLNGTTTLTFTLQNPNPTDPTPNQPLEFTTVEVDDELTGGLQIAQTPNISVSCPSGGSTFFRPNAGDTLLSLSPMSSRPAPPVHSRST